MRNMLAFTLYLGASYENLIAGKNTRKNHLPRNDMYLNSDYCSKMIYRW